MRAILVSLSGLALVLGSCGGGSGSDDQPSPPCSDGEDNDNDGTVDFPDDLGCISDSDDSEDSPQSAACADGRDNDMDGLTDYPGDPGCFAALADNETDDCPSGPNCPACSDDMDNDNSGSMDYPNDPGCESAADDEEFPNNPVACGATLKIETLPVTGIVEGMLDASSTSLLPSPCGGGGGAPAHAYVLHLTKPKVVEISTDDAGTTADTIIDLRGQNCSEASAEIACNDDVGPDNTNSTVTESLQPGSYYIIVSGVDSATSGAFRLQVKLYNGEGNACSGQGDCGPGLVCRTPANGTSNVCSRSVCDDGLDDDADGKMDYPNDPGCTSPDDADEVDDCPTGPNCPECGDGDDNDNDTKADYPMDTTCAAAGDASESCPSTDGVTLITTPMTMGTTTTANNDVTPPVSCASSAHTAKDRTYRIDVPAMTSLDLNLTFPATSFDSTTVLYNATCMGTPIKCSDPANMHVDALAAGTYYFVVDGYSSAAGAYTINVTGKIQNGASCEGELAQSGALTCNTGHACKGPASGRTCQPALCGDGVDNETPTPDGKIDFPFDPGCDSVADDTEEDPNPLPLCSDGIDNDNDGLMDFPADYGCASAAAGEERFCMPETDATALLTAATTMGTTVGKTHNSTPSTCASSTSTAADVVYALSLPVPVDTLTIDTIGTAFDTVVYVKTPACNMPEMACNDDGGGSLTSKITMSAVAPGNYAIIVDGYATTTTPGPFTLNVKGTVAPNTLCGSSLFSGGANAILACPTGTTCQGSGPNARCM
ncbi:MAG: hypothetical protein SFX73_24330 [Kofleriaceae bacterium]|nr:hypothetical protein [Kofleriaceae bacterium]